MKQQLRKLRALYFKYKYKDPGKDILIIGVTGTDGKSTTCEILYQILKASGKSVGLINTIGGKINDETFDTGLHTSTPTSKQVYESLAKMKEKGVTHCILELTSHGLLQHRAFGITLAGCAYTNITHDHFDAHKTFENYRQAKASMMNLLKENGIVSINKNDPNAPFLTDYAKQIKKHIQVVSYALDEQQMYPDTSGVEKVYLAKEIVKVDPHGYSFLLCMANLKYQSFFPLDGLYNVQNALAAISLSIQLQFPLSGIIEGTKQVTNIKGRMNSIQEEPYKLIVDFAHTPNAFHQLFQFLRPQTKGRLIILFGCPSERDDTKRQPMGQEASMNADIIILTAEDPRNEPIENINKDILKGIDTKKFILEKNLFLIPNREEAIKKAIQMALPNDCVALLGKGHEQSNCIGDEELPWNEEAIAKKYLS